MASVSPVPVDSDLTKCPSCQDLCLSPTILPCGHLLCRKCVRNMLEGRVGSNPQCPFCSRRVTVTSGQTVKDLMDSLARDVVLEDLVMGRLAGQTGLRCHVCPKKAATGVCLGCGELYCAACSVAHRQHEAYDLLMLTPPSAQQRRGRCEQNKAKNLTQKDLPRARYNEPISARQHTSIQPDIVASTGITIDDNIRYEHAPRPGQHADMDRLRQEGLLFRETASRLGDAVRVLEDSVAQLLEVKRRVEGKHRLLTAYLPRINTPDDAMLPMLPRLTSLRRDCFPPLQASLSALTRNVKTLTDDGTLNKKNSHSTRNGAVDSSADPMTSTPTGTFTFKPDADDDIYRAGPIISSITATDDGRLVMADCKNNKVKIANPDDPDTTVQAVRLRTTPFRLALLYDGQVAVTADEAHIYFVDVVGTPTVASYVQTTRQYYGVAGSVTEKHTLIAVCHREDDSPASIDILTRAGDVIKTVINSNTLTGMSLPGHLYVDSFDRKNAARRAMNRASGDALASERVESETVWVSDHATNAVFQVELHTGRVLSTYTHPDLKTPLQVAVDRTGHCYVTSYSGNCVLVVSPEGQWRRLLAGSDSGHPQRAYPYGLCVTGRGLVVTWDRGTCFGTDLGSVVSGYELQPKLQIDACAHSAFNPP